MKTTLLTDVEADALNEVFNIGMGQAAASLSQLVNEEVEISVPNIDILTVNDVITLFAEQQNRAMCGVKEGFSGPFQGDAILFFPEADSLELVRALLSDPVTLEELTEMEQDAMNEVGNIILNACLATVSNIFGKEISTSIPQFVHGSIAHLLRGDNENGDETLLFLQMQFSLQIKGHRGYVAFLMDIDSITSLKDCIKPLMMAV